jgi:DNA helicase-2/ATP-dependent DNA helicase PcrA
VTRLALHELNDPQRRAVTTTEGPLLVLAGAGSGKTRVITYRIAHLLERGVDPRHVLAVSFTNKAADEMRQRVEKLVGARQADLLTLCTFHALGLQILKAEKAAVGFRSGFVVYDGADQLGCVRECLRAVQIDDRRFDPKAILARISRAKNAFLFPGEVERKPRPEEKDAKKKRRAGDVDEYDLITEEVYPRYEAALRAFHAFDFDDLIVQPVRLFDRDEEVRDRWQARFRYVMVDEYQDTNRSQLLLLRHLVAAHGNLCVVGDDDQSIYAWRGADTSNILDFERQFPGADKVALEQNYRSTPTILAAANAVIANNGRRHGKQLFSTQADGEKIQLVVGESAEAEADFVATEIELLRARHGTSPNDMAILYRSNLQARAFEESLRQQRVSYRMIGGQAFFERKEVKDAMAYLKATLVPRDEIAVRRIVNYPHRGIGDTTLERCAAHAALHKTTLWEALLDAAEGVEDEASEGPGPLFGGELVTEEPPPPPPEGARPVEGIPPKARRAIRDFVELLERHRERLRAGRELSAAARLLLDDVGLREDLRAAAPSAQAADRRIANLEGFLGALDGWEKRYAERAGPDRGEAATGRALLDYLHRLTLSSSEEDDGDEEAGERVTLATLHGAKGLEWKVVFLVGLEEELLPHKRTLNPSATDISTVDEAGALDLSEERRLMYVGITRARELLYVTRARSRAQVREGGGDRAPKVRTPSRFLDEIPAKLVVARDAEAPAPPGEFDEEAFAREAIAKMLARTGEG